MSEQNSGRRFDVYVGLTIALFAAVLAVTDLFAGKFGDDEIKAINEKSSAYMWYQSKSIKESIVEGQRDLLKSLLAAKAVQGSHLAGLNSHISQLESDLSRYKREKKEILLGSRAVGPDNWAQEIDGGYGKVTGALEFQEQAGALSVVGERLDFASLFLQLCLVMGAVSLVLQSRRAQLVFYSLMVSLGLVGTAFTAYGLLV